MKRIFFFLFLLSYATFLSPVQAQEESGQPAFFSGRSPAGTFREPNLWGRLFGKPACPTPTDQFALAERLEQEGQFRAARRAWEALFLWWPLAPEAPEAVRRLAERLAADEKHEEAFREFQYLLDQYGSALPNPADVIKRQRALADKVIESRRARWLLGGFSRREIAIPLYLQVASNAPRSSLAFEAGLKAAELFEIERQQEQAIGLYYDLLASHPVHARQADIPFRILRAQIELCRRYPHDQNLATRTRTDILRFLSQNPDTPNAPWLKETLEWLDARVAHSLLDRARVYERAGRTALARSLYEQCVRQFPNTPQAEKARARLEKIPPSPSEPSS